MADPNVAALLAALTAQQQQVQQPPRPPSNQPPMPGPPHGYGMPPMPPSVGFSLPQPSSSGNLDLGNIKPSSTGTVSIADAIAKARTIAANKGYRPSDQALPRRRSRSRSRSPPMRGAPGRDFYRDAYNPYRDERRDTGGRDRERDRPYRERSRSPYSPPRRRYGSPPPRRQASRSPGPDEKVMESIMIDSSLVGLIIGRGGETLRKVEQDTGARVQFVTTGDHAHGPERVCNISGKRAQIKDAIDSMATIVFDNSGASGLPLTLNSSMRPPVGMGGGAPPPRPRPGGGPPPPGAPSLREGEDALQIWVPDRTVGLIIGRGGETIRDLQEKSGCHINIVGENKSLNGQRPVNLIGTSESADKAKALIAEIVESDRANTGQNAAAPARSNVNSSEKIVETIRVPVEAVGMIIGKGGETIKEMQNSSGCRINVSSQSNPQDRDREIALNGTRDAIAKAKMLIDDKVDASVRLSRLSQPNQGASTKHMNQPAGMPAKGVQTPMQTTHNMTVSTINAHPVNSMTHNPYANYYDQNVWLNSSSLQQNRGNDRGRQRDYNNDDYGQNRSSYPQQNASGASSQDPNAAWAAFAAAAAASQQPSGANPAAASQQPPVGGAAGSGTDPYAAYGGYERYVQYYWASMLQAQQSAQGGQTGPPAGGSSAPPGT